ncbi:MAG TPA: chaperone NapD [Rhodocyclaceae bacterium]|nr:chaperone NapD [Rhodocyclaceae bacterium]
MKPEVHIAGLLVHTLPENRRKVVKGISGLHRAEVRAGGKAGKLVVVCECDSDDELMSLIGRVRDLPGVLNVALVYQHVESAEAMDEVIADAAEPPRIH